MTALLTLGLVTVVVVGTVISFWSVPWAIAFMFVAGGIDLYWTWVALR